MKKITAYSLVAVFLFLLTACPYGYRFDEGKFPSEPVNFAPVNSIYDDYNSTSPVIESERYLYFSSNRNSDGHDFDIVGDNFHVLWDKEDGRLTVDNMKSGWRNFDFVDTLFTLMNSGFNEYGPYSLPFYEYSDSYDFTDLVIFSNDESGSLDLKFVWFTAPNVNPVAAEGTFGGPEPISFLNSAFNDAYLTFYGPGYINFDYVVDPLKISELLFCSDRNGNFDIFKAAVSGESSILDFLINDESVQIIPVDILNSGYHDKCPHVDGELLVFTSDRPGGFGGFDLYYSRRDGNKWSAPVNFGEKINTEYDEYRPIIMHYYEFTNDLMLFSSNRPGGKGGYDLYYVGIPQMVE